MLMDEPFAARRADSDEPSAGLTDLGARRPTIFVTTTSEAVFLEPVISTPRPSRSGDHRGRHPSPRNWDNLIEDTSFRRLTHHIMVLTGDAREPQSCGC
jgi:hypothetical protein